MRTKPPFVKAVRAAETRARGSGTSASPHGNLSNEGDAVRSAPVFSYDPPVAYDEELADRIRELVGGEPALTEQKMFGGLAFLIGGNMAVAASGQGGLLVRADPDESDTLVATTSARLMEMRGREMRGWLRVDADDVRSEGELAKWVEVGTAYARSLPAK
jgi:TfoX/Sxy family transcriptional regulator of competence genes